MGRDLIGRRHPAGELRASVTRAVSSHGGLMLVTGEAGIGKTTLVAQAAEEARELGALVLGGSCWDSQSAPGYWPWTQVMRGLRRAATEEEWAAAEAAAEAAGEGCLPALLGEPGGRGGAVPSGGDSFRFHDAVTAVLATAAQRRPLVVVLDDLHWADADSLRLLDFAAQHTWFERLLLVGTYRDVEVEAGEHPLRPLVLPLLAKATTLTLTGLSDEETALLMERTTGVRPEPALVDEVHARTGGNPFFVEQTARLWSSGGSASAVALGVRDALQRRLTQLPGSVTALLTTASVLGRRFHRQRLAAVAAEPVPRVDRLLDRAVVARLVTVEGGGAFAFAHDLVRETLYDALEPAEARRRHAAAVRAADGSGTAAGGPASGPADGPSYGGAAYGGAARERHALPAELARHGYLAGDELEPYHVIELLTSAATDAEDRFAFEEALTHRRRALERVPAEDRRSRAVLGLTLGAGLHGMGAREEAWEELDRAIAVARETDDAELLGRAALTAYRTGDVLERAGLIEELLCEAHARLLPDAGGGPGARKAFVDQLVEEISARLATLVRDNGDVEALSFGLWARHDIIWGPGSADERESLTREMVNASRRAGDQAGETLAASLRWVALLQLGDPGYADQLQSMARAAEGSGLPRCLMMAAADRSIVAAHRGRFAEAEQRLEQAYVGEARCTVEGAFMERHLHWSYSMLQGRFTDLQRLHEEIGDNGHPHPRLLAALTAVQSACWSGDGVPCADAPGVASALAYVTEQLDDGARFSRGIQAMWLRLLAQTAAASGDPGLIARARTDLAPYRGEWAVAAYGCDIGGPVVLWSALLDAADGRWDAAVDGLTEACRSAEALGLRAWLLEARSYLCGALLARGGTGDARTFGELLDQVEREAESIGMRHVVRRARTLRERAARRPAPGAETGAGTGGAAAMGAP
ncbi:ATP-binding protein, partial [Streptomyces boncukensis]